jgi:hypothetical protein
MAIPIGESRGTNLPEPQAVQYSLGLLLILDSADKTISAPIMPIAALLSAAPQMQMRPPTIKDACSPKKWVRPVGPTLWQWRQAALRSSLMLVSYFVFFRQYIKEALADLVEGSNRQ